MAFHNILQGISRSPAAQVGISAATTILGVMSLCALSTSDPELRATYLKCALAFATSFTASAAISYNVVRKWHPGQSFSFHQLSFLSAKTPSDKQNIETSHSHMDTRPKNN